MKLSIRSIPRGFAVQPLKPGQEAKDKCTCGTCGLSWDDAIPTSYTPAPSGRCPFEYFHASADDGHGTESVVTWATNTGEWYKTLCNMARHGADVGTWHAYVQITVLPDYRYHNKSARNVAFDTRDIAQHLDAYYQDHIKEGKR